MVMDDEDDWIDYLEVPVNEPPLDDVVGAFGSEDFFPRFRSLLIKLVKKSESIWCSLLLGVLCGSEILAASYMDQNFHMFFLTLATWGNVGLSLAGAEGFWMGVGDGSEPVAVVEVTSLNFSTAADAETGLVVDFLLAASLASMHENEKITWSLPLSLSMTSLCLARNSWSSSAETAGSVLVAWSMRNFDENSLTVTWNFFGSLIISSKGSSGSLVKFWLSKSTLIFATESLTVRKSLFIPSYLPQWEQREYLFPIIEV